MCKYRGSQMILLGVSREKREYDPCVIPVYHIPLFLSNFQQVGGKIGGRIFGGGLSES